MIIHFNMPGHSARCSNSGPVRRRYITRGTKNLRRMSFIDAAERSFVIA
jgi:hypothetical protein